jgi:hypothetical protein
VISRIWEQNKKFILVTGGSLAIFLFINSFLGGYIESADGPKGLLAKSSQLEREVRTLHKDLQNRYWEEKSRLESYEKHETELRSKVELSPEPELSKLDTAAPSGQFNRAVDRIWGQALEKANRATVAIPEKPGPEDFGIEKEDGKAEYERHYDYLGVMRRALSVLVDSGMSEIGRPEIVEEEVFQVVPGDESVHCVLRSVRFKVAGPYESFVKTVKGVQAPKEFLQARVEMEQKPGDDRTVRGHIEFASVRLVEGYTKEREAAPTPKVKQRPGRRGNR